MFNRKKKAEALKLHTDKLISNLKQLATQEVPAEEVHLLFPGLELDRYEKSAIADAYAHGSAQVRKLMTQVRITGMMQWLEEHLPELGEKVQAHMENMVDNHKCETQPGSALEQVKDLLESLEDDE